MFDNLTDTLGRFFRGISVHGKKLTEDNIKDGLREVRMALLEADVSFKLVRQFIRDVEEKAIGEKIVENVNPAQQIVKIVHDRLIELLGKGDTSINFNPSGPTVILMAGLQGSGKTTTCGKLANYLLKKGRRPLLVAADIQRPAAIDQLKVIGGQLDVPVYSEAGIQPPQICANAIAQARQTGRDIVILDTAGRLHIDDALMQELHDVSLTTKPQEIFLVADAMTGQDAVNSADEFNKRLEITGVILTKLDGDARGGAALSLRAITGKPIKFAGVGEKFDRLEEFHPERMATRILGMGDVVSLVEKAQEVMDESEALAMQKKLARQTLTLDDFLTQFQRIRKMGSIKDLLGMIPGFSAFKQLEVSDAEFSRVEAIIKSMTREERAQPLLVTNSPTRKRRIALGSGTEIRMVNDLLKQFNMVTRQLSSVMKAQKFMDRVTSGQSTPDAGAGKYRTTRERKQIQQRRKKEKQKRRQGRR